MLAITTQEYDPDGELIIYAYASGNDSDISRRGERVQTLDMGAVFTDGGFSDGDREFSYVVEMIHYSALEYLLKTYSVLRLSNQSGLYAGSLIDVVRDGSNCRFRFLPTSNLTADKPLITTGVAEVGVGVYVFLQSGAGV